MKKVFSICTAVSLLLLSSACHSASLQSGENGVISDTSGNNVSDESSAPAEDIVIKMAKHTHLCQEVANAVRAFNAAENGYTIEYVDYGQYDGSDSYDSGGGKLPGGWVKADFELQMDILEGDVIHIVPDVAFDDQGKFELLTEKGAFCDLYSFMEADADVNKDTMNSHVLQLHERDGKLCYLPTFYRVETMFGDAAYVGSKENWTFDELVEHWNAMPDGATFNYNVDKYGVFNEVLRSNIGAFVDYENGTCSFDSPEFVEMMEFCNSFRETDDDKTNPEADTLNFVMGMAFLGFEEYHRVLWSDTGKDYTFVGYPSEDGSGAFLNASGYRYAISADAPPEVQEGAWEFLRMLADEEFCCDMYDNYNGLTGFPVNQAAFERLAQEEMHKSEELQGKIGCMTQAEYDRLVTFIESVQRLHTSMEDGLWNIFYEELDALFAGEQTAHQAADSIQGRAEIYLGERM